MSNHLPQGLKKGYLQASGMEFRYFSSGPAGGQPVLMLHGFPSTSLMWGPQLEALGKEGYLCVAPDLRGISPNARPEGEHSYYYPKLAADVMAIADALRWRTFHLVTHDHGSLLGWVVAKLYPSRLRSFASLTVPHPDAFSDGFFNDIVQQRASQYFNMFKAAGSEHFVFNNTSAKNGANSIAANHNYPQYYKDDWQQIFTDASVMRKALWWYNGAMASFVATPPILEETLKINENIPNPYVILKLKPAPAKPALSNVGQITVPTLYVWGSEDGALTREPAEATSKYVDAPYEFVELKCDHWMTFTATKEVNAALSKHLSKYSSLGKL